MLILRYKAQNPEVVAYAFNSSSVWGHPGLQSELWDIQGLKSEGKKYKKQMKSTFIKKKFYKNTFTIKNKNKSLNLKIDLFGFDVCLFWFNEQCMELGEI